MPQLPPSEKFAILKNLMHRTDLGAPALRIAWLLLMERANAETGLCYCSNRHIAEQLDLKPRTVERAKAELKTTGLITWVPGQQDGTACTYRFKTRLERHSRRDTKREPDVTSKLTLPSKMTPGQKTNAERERNIALGFIVPKGETGFRHKVETGQWRHWNAYSWKTRNKPAPASNGGWTFRYNEPNEAIT